MPSGAPKSIGVTTQCPNEACGTSLRASVTDQWPSELSCPACGATKALKGDAPSPADRSLQRCPVCGGVEFFIRKDFPQQVGLCIVIAFGLAATVCYFYKMIVACFAILSAAVLLDALIYLFVGRVTVCYRCRAELRNIAYNPEHKGFDLATSEKYG